MVVGRLTLYKKISFGFCRLRRGINSRNSHEQAKRVALVTPLADGEDFKANNCLFSQARPSA